MDMESLSLENPLGERVSVPPGGARKPRAAMRWWPVRLCAALGCVLSLSAYLAVAGWERDQVSAEFQRQAVNVTAVLYQQLEQRVQSVSYLRRFFEGSQHVSPAEFRRFVDETLDVCPDIKMVGWAPLPSYGEDAAIIDEIRKAGCADFEIRRTDGDALCIPLTLIEPHDDTEALHGLDLCGVPEIRSTLLRARTTEQVTVSQPIQLGLPVHSRAGVVIAAPVLCQDDRPEHASLRASLRGFVLMYLDVADLCDAVVAEVDFGKLDLHLYAGPTASVENYLYDSDGQFESEINSEQLADMRWAATVGIGGQQWLMDVRPQPGFGPAGIGWLRVGVLSGGLLLTLILSAYLHAIFRRTAHTEVLIRQRTQELRDSYARLQATARAKSEFLANMSHEIRTPMTAILGFAEILSETAARGMATESTIAAVETIRRNGEHLLRIINDILDLSKIEAGKFNMEHLATSPRHLVTEIMSLMKVRADVAKLTLAVECVEPMPDTIETDPTRLRQILINLVGNAIKFTPKGGVRLVARFVEEPDGPGAEASRVRGIGEANDADQPVSVPLEPPAPRTLRPFLQFDVIDTGIGLTTEQIGSLFDSFTQADTSTARRFGGTGLGLSLSKKLAVMLGGRLSVTSTPGAGSTFTLSIPVGVNEQEREQGPGVQGSEGRGAGVRAVDPRNRGLERRAPLGPSAPRPLDPRTGRNRIPARAESLKGRILLGEDSPDNERLISFILRKAGAQVESAPNGRLAVDQAWSAQERGAPFDVILMDMQMPVMSGFEATRLLRNRGYRGAIVALTANAMADDRTRCLAAGCDDYESKPIDRQRLFALLRKYLPDPQPPTESKSSFVETT